MIDSNFIRKFGETPEEQMDSFLRHDAVIRDCATGTPASAISTARRPVSSPNRSRSESTAGMVLPPGRTKPSVSARQAIVLAVPITMQVPCAGISRSCARPSPASSISPARHAAHSLRQSVEAPSRSPS